ncbi:Outer membrane efflux protein precursor [Prochlorococcus marinus str. LG]|nr:Outer membrane efflux protein precursor [Prochlorococcus marinus str. LG]
MIANINFSPLKNIYFKVFIGITLANIMLDVGLASSGDYSIKNHETLSSSARIKDSKHKLIGQIEKVKIASSDRSKKVRKSLEKFKILNNKVIKLEDLEDLIKANSYELKIMRKRIEETRYLLKSKVSAWYPNLDISSTGFPQYLKGNTFNKLSTNTSSNQLKASLKATLKWDVINPARIPQIAAARDEFERQRIAYTIKMRDLVLEAQNQFFNLQKSLQDIRIAKDSIKTSKISLNEARIRFKSGIGSKLDVLDAKTQLSNDKQLLADRLGNKKIYQRKLAQLLNLKPNTTPIIGSKPKVIGIWKISLEESINYAIKYRKELDQISLQISMNENNAKAALAGKKPTVSIYNTFDSSLSKGETFVSSPRTNNSINSQNNTLGLQFNWPIFDGGYSKARYNAKKEKVKELEARIALKKTEIRKEVEEIFYKLNISKESIKNSYEAIQSSKESLRLSILRLKTGITTQREVIVSQRDLTQAEVNHIKSITDYNTNLITLQRKTGIKKLQNCEDKDTNALSEKNLPNHLSLNEEACIGLL